MYAESEITAIHIREDMDNAAKLSRNLSRVNVGCRQKKLQSIETIVYLWHQTEVFFSSINGAPRPSSFS